jgi:hypothetical protein
MVGDTTITRTAVGSVAAALLAAAALVGCGQDAKTTAAITAVPHFKPTTPVKKGPSAEELTAGMAMAPTLGKSSLPLDVKFELADRPKIGQMLEINLALVPQIAGGPVTVQISGATGMDVAQGENQFELTEVEAGEVYRHTLRVTPSADGVLLTNITVSLKHEEIDDSKAFSIPVIVDR